MFWKKEPVKQNNTVNIDADYTAMAAEIVKRANLKALQILENSNIFSRNLRKDMESSIDHLSNTLLDTYKQAVEEEKQRNIEKIADISEEVRDELVEHVGEFKSALEQETIKTQELIKEKTDTAYQDVMKQLDEYKASEFRKIDEKIYEILVTAVKKSVGKTINTQAHAEIILESLDEAKKEGVFDEA
jgi:hypothetical protein